MPPVIETITGLLKVTPRYASAGMLASGFLLWAPFDFVRQSKILKEHRDWLILLFVVCCSVCVVAIAIHVWHVVKKKLKARADGLAKERVLYAVSDEEKEFIRPYLRERIRTLELDARHACVQRLVQGGMLYQTTKGFRSVVGENTLLADFSVTDWVWDLAEKDSRLREWFMHDKK